MYMKTKQKLKIKKVTFLKFLFESFSSFLPHPSNHPPFTHLHPSFPLYIFTLSNKEIKLKGYQKVSSAISLELTIKDDAMQLQASSAMLPRAV